MTARTRTLMYAIIAFGWLALGVANLVKHQVGLGALYLSIGVVCAAMAAASQRNRGTH